MRTLKRLTATSIVNVLKYKEMYKRYVSGGYGF